MTGNMVDWWTEEDGQEYEKRVEVMVKQANEYEVHGQAVKVCRVSDILHTKSRPTWTKACSHLLHWQGKLTSGENIADLGSSQ